MSFTAISDLQAQNNFCFVLVWCKNAGLEFEENVVDMNETRFLCDKHFSKNYISSQSRRKMLVHTAIPVKFAETVILNNSRNLTVVGGSSFRKRKIRELDIEALEESAPKSIVNDENCEFVLERIQDEEENETFEIEESDNLNEEKDNVQFLVVSENESKQTIRKKPKENLIPVFQEVELVEDDEQSTSHETPAISAPQQLEGYSEFIFSGEKYVQMPKRTFDAEKRKLTDEIEKYKNMLKKMKTFLNKIDC